jgi:hypothetical protein
MTRIPLFSSQDLEAACRVLADTERGLSGTQIERLLQEIEVADTSPGMTKWKRLFNALAGAQNQHQVGNPLAHAPKTNWPMSEQDALDILTLVSLIHRKLDGTQKTTIAEQ